MDLVTESTYDDSVFEHDTLSPDTTKQSPRKADTRETGVTKAENSDSGVTKHIQDSKDFFDADDTTLPVLDSTTNTANLHNESDRNDTTVIQTNETVSNKTAIQNLKIESIDEYSGNKHVERKPVQTRDKERQDELTRTPIDDKEYIEDKHSERNPVQTQNNEQPGELTKRNDKRTNLAEALANYEKPIENIQKSPRKDKNSQNQSNIPPSRLGRQESDLTSLKSMRSSEFESRQFVNSDRFYYHSGFPSLIANLGQNATNRTTKVKNQKPTSSPKRPEVFKDIDDANRLSKTHHKKQYAAFSLSMKRKNESTWTRIEAVAKEKMELYERYAIDMTIKLKRQREQINRRSQELLDSLAKIEEKKKEDKIYDSPHGRIWRHHRSMQRRVFNLEPMSSRDKGYKSMSSGRTEVTENQG